MMRSSFCSSKYISLLGLWPPTPSVKVHNNVHFPRNITRIANAVQVTLRLSATNPHLAFWWPLGDHLVTIWYPTWWPLGYHMGTTWWPLGDHFLTTWWPLQDYLVTPWWPIGDQLVTTWWPLDNHMVTTWSPYGDHMVILFLYITKHSMTACGANLCHMGSISPFLRVDLQIRDRA